MDSQHPFFSIITPTFNRISFLKDAINSVLSQDFYDWELLIIDDCSNDGTMDFLSEEIHDERIKYFINKNNIGAGGSRNIGINFALGEFIVFLDSDNILDPQYLTKFRNNILKKPHCQIFWCGVRREISLSNGEVLLESHLWVPDPKKTFFYLTAIRTSTGRGLVIRRKSLLEVGLFDERLPAAEDTELLLRLFRVCDFFVIKEYLYFSKIHKGERLSTNYKKQARAYDLIIDKHSVFFKENIKDSGRFYRKAANYHYKSGSKVDAVKYIWLGLRNNFLDFKYYPYLIKFLLK